MHVFRLSASGGLYCHCGVQNLIVHNDIVRHCFLYQHVYSGCTCRVPWQTALLSLLCQHWREKKCRTSTSCLVTVSLRLSGSASSDDGLYLLLNCKCGRRWAFFCSRFSLRQICTCISCNLSLFSFCCNSSSNVMVLGTAFLHTSLQAGAAGSWPVPTTGLQVAQS
jgi:hypothetical protein